MSAGDEMLVCVTGASGYIASWLVKELLHRGYTVRASVRNLNDPKRTEHLMALEGAKARLHLFEAELLEEGSFDSAIYGCRGVFHTATSCLQAADDPQTQILDPAIKGTLNVLASCAKNPCLKRVVLTSSIAAVLYNDRPKTPDVVVDESWFSDPDFCLNEQKWYQLSKTLAEEAAWKFAREKGVDLIVINPGLVLGPILPPSLNVTCAYVLSLLKGEFKPPHVPIYPVHIKDVVEAHIRAYEIPSAKGRYCLVERVAPYSEIINILNDIYPELQLPHMSSDDKPYALVYQIAKEKVKALGIDYIPIEIGFKDIVESFKERKFISF